MLLTVVDSFEISACAAAAVDQRLLQCRTFIEPWSAARLPAIRHRSKTRTPSLLTMPLYRSQACFAAQAGALVAAAGAIDAPFLKPHI